MTLRFPSIFLSVSDLFAAHRSLGAPRHKKIAQIFIEKYLVDSKKTPYLCSAKPKHGEHSSVG